MPRYRTTLTLRCEAEDRDDVEYLIKMMQDSADYYSVKLERTGYIIEQNEDGEDIE